MDYMKNVKFAPFCFLLSGCATIMTGTTQTISINTTPSNANVWVDGIYVGASPISVNMKRDKSHIVRVELEGYQPCEMVLNKELNEWVFGNIIFGHFIGLAVDAISGSIYKLTPEQANMRLEQNVAYSSKTEDSYVAVIVQADPSWEKIGSLVANR